MNNLKVKPYPIFEKSGSVNLRNSRGSYTVPFGVGLAVRIIIVF
jgi:hypothetical protein